MSQADRSFPSETVTRREVLRRALRLGAGMGAGALAGAAFGPGLLAAGPGSGVARTSSLAAAGSRPARQDLIRKVIPSSGEQIPAIGMGTWQTFMVGESEEERAPLREVLRSFVELGGEVIDSSPMYDPAEEVTGEIASDMGLLDDLWIATKVWTEGRDEGIEQMNRSLSELRSESIQLMQVHNLVDAAVHLETLEQWRDEGRIRYIGITTSSERQYPDVLDLLDDDRLDFLQVNYSLAEQESAERVLPAARERGLAVMINRPFAGGSLFSRAQGHELPEWASEIDCEAWSQFFLKYVISHPAVTVAIPATSDPEHLRENMGAGVGRLPDQAMRERMEQVIEG